MKRFLIAGVFLSTFYAYSAVSFNLIESNQDIEEKLTHHQKIEKSLSYTLARTHQISRIKVAKTKLDY